MSTEQGREPRALDTISRPLGGYRRISTVQICMAWCAYQIGLLARYFDFRVYLALHEVEERQCVELRLLKGRNGTPRQPEAKKTSLIVRTAKLMGVTNERQIQAATRRLERAGLLEISGSRVVFAKNLEALPEPLRDAAESMLARIDWRERVRNRIIPIPRKMLRLLCRESSPTLAATVFGHAMRCLWLHGSGCKAAGTCSVQFISEVFGIHLRSVLRGRKRLKELGWLTCVTEKHEGGKSRTWFLVNMNWAPPAKEPLEGKMAHCSSGELVAAVPPRDTDLSPLLASKRSVVLPLTPRLDTVLSSPIRGDHSCINKPSTKTKYQRTYQSPKSSAGYAEIPGVPKGNDSKPDLRRVVPIDLRTLDRLDAIHEQAANAGLVGKGAAARLQIIGAAEHAMRVGATNPCGLFVAVVRRGLWRFISQADEDRARRRLREAEPGTSWQPRCELRHALNGSREVSSAIGVEDVDQKVLALVRDLAEQRSLSRFVGKTEYETAVDVNESSRLVA